MARLLLLLLVCGIPAPLLAQISDLEGLSRDVSDWARTQDPVPDTTAPWRYYPVEAGNVWEYDLLTHPEGRVFRVWMVRDTVINDTVYTIRRIEGFNADGSIGYPGGHHAIRYDTLSASIRVYHPIEGEVVDPLGFCPFDIPFYSTILCWQNNEFFVWGDHDGYLKVFDMHNVTHKVYEGWHDNWRYVADLGLAAKVFLSRQGDPESDTRIRGTSSEGGGWFDAWLIRYARVNGITYGTPLYPIGIDPLPTTSETNVGITIHPNPAWAQHDIWLTYSLPFSSRHTSATIYDLLGRRVGQWDLGEQSQGAHALSIKVDFPTGVYVLQLVLSDANQQTTVRRRITIIR